MRSSIQGDIQIKAPTADVFFESDDCQKTDLCMFGHLQNEFGGLKLFLFTGELALDVAALKKKLEPAP